MTRNRMKVLAWPLALALLVVACGDNTGDGPGDGPKECQPGETDGDLIFFNWSEYMDPDLITAFEEEYEVQVTQDYFDSNESMIARLQAGNAFDVVVPSDYMVGIMIIENLLNPLQRAAIPNLANLDPDFANPDYDPGGVYSAAYQWGTTGLGVNLSVVGEDFDPSWALVFDPAITAQYPDGFSLLNDPREAMGAALLYLGFSINSTNESELEAASDLISAARPTAFDSDLFASRLINEEFSVTQGFSGQFASGIADSDDPDQWEYIIPKEGGTIWTDNMVIPRTSTHPCTAHTFINFLLDAENGAQLSEWNYYATPNAAAMELLDEEMLQDPVLFPDDETMERLHEIVDTGAFELKFNDYFTRARN